AVRARQAARGCGGDCARVVAGPQVLGWARVDDAVRVLSVLGLGFLLLLAGLEVDVRRLRRRVLGVAVVAFAVSFGLTFAAGLALESAGLVRSAWLAAVVLSATSLGVLLPVLDDAGQLTTRPGQVVLAGATVAEVVPVVLLSVLFAGRTTALAPKLLMLALFALLVAVLVGALAGSGACTCCRTRCRPCRTRPPRSGSAASSCCSCC
ncbi:MAG: cation:proton antiporter, partial [Janthinobacterium lividum]